MSLEKKYNVPAELGPIPIGVQNTYQFLRNLKKLTGNDVTDEILDERGLLIDSMGDFALRYCMAVQLQSMGILKSHLELLDL